MKTTKKILFIYGIYSIHAEKRMKIFLEDSRFEIAIISRFDYSVKGINCFKLNDYRDNINYTNRSKFFRGYLYLKQLVAHFCFIKKVIKSFRPNIIFLQTLLYPAFLCFGISKKIPIIITFWNGDVTWWAKWDFIEKLFKYNIVKKGIAKAKLITVNSEYAKECCKKYYNNFEKIIVLPYPGIDRSIFFPKSESQKKFFYEKYKIEPGYVFFCPRGLASYLNNTQILSALSNLKNSIKFTTVYLLGNASKNEVDEFKKLIQKFDLVGYIKIIDNLSPYEMSEIYSISDITISISSNDSLPNCMLESMSCGTIVLMGDILQIREWIIEEETGFLCEIGNVEMLISKINFILTQKLVIKQIKENSLKIIEERADLDRSKYLIKQLILNVQ